MSWWTLRAEDIDLGASWPLVEIRLSEELLDRREVLAVRAEPEARVPVRARAAVAFGLTRAQMLTPAKGRG
jgi:hypothetical protein